MWATVRGWVGKSVGDSGWEYVEAEYWCYSHMVVRLMTIQLVRKGTDTWCIQDGDTATAPFHTFRELKG